MAKLANEQHEQFCHEFLVDFNQTKAAQRAKFSAKSARNQGGRLMQNDEILRRIQELHATQLAKVDVNIESVLLELKRLAHCDLNDAFNSLDGTLLPLNEIPVDIRKCISGFEVEELWMSPKDGARVQIGVVKKVKFWDKNKSLEMLGKYLKMFTQKVEHSADSSLEALIMASMQKKDV